MDVISILIVETNKPITILAKLVALYEDPMKYTTYVFECLEDPIMKETKYIMCTRFPNWNTPSIVLEDIGYLCFKEVIGGKDKWFDGTKFVPYAYNGIHFLNFIIKPKEIKNKFIM